LRPYSDKPFLNDSLAKFFSISFFLEWLFFYR
jgi:hypothetical protein